QVALATAGLASFVFPNLAGRLKGSMAVSGALWGGETHWQGFVGVLPFFLAVVGALASIDRRRIPYAVLGVSAIVSVLFTPVATVLYERSFLPYIFCACVLAAFGCDALEGSPRLDVVRARFAVRLLSGFMMLILGFLLIFNISLAVWESRILAY